MLALLGALALLGCVRFEGLPDMPAHSAADPSVYASSKAGFAHHVTRARLLVRTANVSWTLRGTAGEQLASRAEIREKFAGVIFVGDSQIREVAWAAMQMLTPKEVKRMHAADRVLGRLRAPGKSACVPQTIGKTGFTASCTDADGACELHSPFHNKSHAEAMRKLLLTQPHKWDGKLSVSESACHSDFFLSYQATWGAMPIDPNSLPKCMHPAAGEATNSILNKRTGVRKPILWIIDGCGLHEMEFCDARRWTLPQSVLPLFPDALRRSGTVVWQTVGAGFLMKASRRFKGDCAEVNADQVAQTESTWLNAHGVRHYNYTRVSLQYAPMMFDAIHFTYYWVPCAYTFPEMARLVAQLGFQQAVGRPVEVCPPGMAPPVEPAAAAAELGLPGGSHVSLAQDAEQTAAAYSAALKLSGKAELLGKGKGALSSHAMGKAASTSAPNAAAAAAGTASAASVEVLAGDGAAKAPGGGMHAAIRKVALEFGGKKHAKALEAAIARITSTYGLQSSGKA